MPDRDDDQAAALLTVRTALVFLLSVLAGTGAAVLTCLAGHRGAEAVLIGLGVLAAAIKFFHWLIR
ncbi:hypothetical protein [Amycolatopsis sp. ATCC 39116]|uniref:hypothetical protein n=1 Tax=Amycolatopsis sp. (strain ATCC 39116 / 75iv2) TaxID=385957 RepID=UPI0002625D11|nr:hypothetical protein [Amycolatopsis sp. ATCC 39116]